MFEVVPFKVIDVVCNARTSRRTFMTTPIDWRTFPEESMSEEPSLLSIMIMSVLYVNITQSVSPAVSTDTLLETYNTCGRLRLEITIFELLPRLCFDPLRGSVRLARTGLTPKESPS